MTLIDTPGIGSVHHEFSETTEEFLAEEADSAAAAQRADAVVFLFNQVVMQDELEALQMFRAASGNDPNRSAASAVGVLSKADQLGDGTRDPWNVAIELAGVYAGKFRNEVATVVPVVGLVAEASEAATLTELDAKQLSALAAMDEAAFSKLLWSTDRFTSADAPVPSEKRERLLAMLDLYGMQNAVKFLRNGTHGAFALRRELSALSGISEVKRTLAKYFSEQDHVLKVRSVLDALNRMTFAHVDGPESVGPQAIPGPGRRVAPRPGDAPDRRARSLALVLHRQGEAPARAARRGRPTVRSWHTREPARHGQRGPAGYAPSLSGRDGALADIHTSLKPRPPKPRWRGPFDGHISCSGRSSRIRAMRAGQREFLGARDRLRDELHRRRRRYGRQRDDGRRGVERTFATALVRLLVPRRSRSSSAPRPSTRPCSPQNATSPLRSGCSAKASSSWATGSSR